MHVEGMMLGVQGMPSQGVYAQGGVQVCPPSMLLSRQAMHMAEYFEYQDKRDRILQLESRERERREREMSERRERELREIRDKEIESYMRKRAFSQL